MSGNNSRYNPENSKYLTPYNGTEKFKETFPPEKMVEASVGWATCCPRV